MGKVGKVVAGIGLIITGAVIGVFTGQWQLAFAVASLGAGLLMQPKMPDVGSLTDRTGAILENRVGATQSLPIVYGTVKIAGVFADIRIHDASTERKRLVLITAFCQGSRDGTGVTSIDEMWFDDRKAVEGSLVQAPFSQVVPAQTPTIEHLQFEHHLGETTQVVDSRLTQLFPVQWPVEARGRGICYSRLEMWYNTTIFPGGIPTIQCKIRGNKVYDPRDATWKHSTNPALCIRDYILSTIYGMAIAEANIEEQSFVDMANYCDELVSIPGGGTQKRFEMNGWVDTARSVEQNLAEMCTSCRGQVVNEGDRWRMIIRRARSVSGFKINEKNTVEGSWQFILPGADLCPNVMRASYVDPARNYTVDTVQWPEPGQPNQFLTDDNAYEQRLEMDLPFTDNRLRAQQIGMTLLKESREAIGVVSTLKEEGLQCRVGELVEVTYPTPGWVDKVFDVAALMLSPDGQVRAVLIEYEPTVYDLDTQFSQPVAQDTNLPNPFAISAPTSLVLVSSGQELVAPDGGSIPRIRLTWSKANDPFVDYYEIQAKKTADADWDTFGRHPGLEVAFFYVYPVTADESWSVRIRAVNRLGVVSTWVSGTHTPVVNDPRPQVLSITLTNAHGDSGAHVDTHTDVAHGDAAHTDAHTDTAHTDHTDHGDSHGDAGGHDDVAHGDSHGDVGLIDTDHTDTHSDNAHSDHSDGHSDTHTDTDHSDTAHTDSHGDIGAVDTDHTDTHSDNAHTDHTDSGYSHTDVSHVDSHTDTSHSDSAHSDGHTDTSHGDGAFGVGIAIQADQDSASIKAIARKHGDHSDGSHTDVSDPTIAEVRTATPVNGRNAVITLMDVATGAQIALNPGDQVRVGAVAYSDTGAGGVEGPLALASVGMFTVAPVGTDKWVPS